MLRPVNRVANRIPAPALMTAAIPACVLVALVPLGHAAPPDQTWIAGLYDDADHDHVVRAIVAPVAVAPARPPRVASSTAAEPLPRPRVSRTPGPVALITGLDRAPPLA